MSRVRGSQRAEKSEGREIRGCSLNADRRTNLLHLCDGGENSGGGIRPGLYV